MPYVNPGNSANPNIRNTSMPDSQGTGNDIRKNAVHRSVPGKQFQFTPPGQEQMDQFNGADPNDRYNQIMHLMGQQLGNQKGNLGLKFNQGQQDWLHTLNGTDLMSELSKAFAHQRPRFGMPHPAPQQPQQPQVPQGGGVPSPLNGGGLSGGGMSHQTGGAYWAPPGGTAQAPMPQGPYMQVGNINGQGYNEPYQTPGYVPGYNPFNPIGNLDMSGFGGGSPSPINGGGYTASSREPMLNPYGQPGQPTSYGQINGGGYQAPGMNPNLVNIINALRTRRPQSNY